MDDGERGGEYLPSVLHLKDTRRYPYVIEDNLPCFLLLASSLASSNDVEDGAKLVSSLTSLTFSTLFFIIVV